MRRQPFTDAEITRMRELYESGRTGREVAEEMGCKELSVLKRLRKLGVTRTRGGARVGNLQPHWKLCDHAPGPPHPLWMAGKGSKQYGTLEICVKCRARCVTVFGMTPRWLAPVSRPLAKDLAS